MQCQCEGFDTMHDASPSRVKLVRPPRDIFMLTQQAARRELAAATKVPNLEHIDNISEVCIGVVMTLVGTAVIMLSTLAFQLLVEHRHVQKEFMTVTEIKEAMGNRPLAEVFAGCTDEYGEVDADLSCWSQTLAGIFQSDVLAERAFMSFDCDRDFFVDSRELDAAFRANVFLCSVSSAASASASPATVVATAPPSAAVERVWAAAEASTSRLTASSTRAAAPAVSAAATTLTSTGTATRSTSTTVLLPTSPTPPRPPPLPQVSSVGPLSLDGYRQRLSNAREHVAVEIVISGLPFTEMKPDQLAELSLALVGVIARKVGVEYTDIVDQQGRPLRFSLAGVAGHEQVMAACDVTLPLGTTLSTVRSILSSFETKQYFASQVANAVGRHIEHLDVMPWVESGEDIMSRLSPLSPEAIPKRDFVNYASANMHLSSLEADSVFEALDRNHDQHLSDTEFFV